jgi:hypothetical protein
MKYLILIPAFFCIASFAHAQRMELGGNIGAAYTADANVANILPYYSLKGAYNVCSGFQVGLSGSITHLPFEYVTSSELFSSTVPPITPVFDIYSPGTQLVHNLKGFANVKRNMGSWTVYSGVSAGIMNAIHQDNFVKSKKPTTSLTSGYSAGVQAGATYNVTKRFGINAELGADYINMKANGADYGREAGKNNLTTINTPLTIGFRYKLSCPCPKSCPLGKREKAAE